MTLIKTLSSDQKKIEDEIITENGVNIQFEQLFRVLELLNSITKEKNMYCFNFSKEISPKELNINNYDQPIRILYVKKRKDGRFEIIIKNKVLKIADALWLSFLTLDNIKIKNEEDIEQRVDIKSIRKVELEVNIGNQKIIKIELNGFYKVKDLFEKINKMFKKYNLNVEVKEIDGEYSVKEIFITIEKRKDNNNKIKKLIELSCFTNGIQIKSE